MKTTMSTKTWKPLLAGVFAAGAFGGVALGIAWATPGFGITITPIAGPALLGEVNSHSKSKINDVRIKTKGLSNVYVSRLEIAPGGHGGWHSHPGPSIITVKSGQATFYHADDPDQTPLLHAAGTTFVEDDGDVHIVRNEGSVPLELVVLQIVPAGAPRRIDEPRPPHYDF